MDKGLEHLGSDVARQHTAKMKKLLMECNKGDGDLVDQARWEETILDNELEWMRKWQDGGISVGRPKQSIGLCKH